MKDLYKGQTIAVHVLDEHVIPRPPLPVPRGGTVEQWEAYWKKCYEIVGPVYEDVDIIDAGYFITEVEEVVGDQVMFQDSFGGMRLVPGTEVITIEEAPQAFLIWMQRLENQME